MIVIALLTVQLQRHDNQHKELLCDTQHHMLSVVGCNYAKCHCGECHYAECRYAECYYAECGNATNASDLPIFFYFLNFFPKPAAA
jgi:hypothetical protein